MITGIVPCYAPEFAAKKAPKKAKSSSVAQDRIIATKLKPQDMAKVRLAFQPKRSPDAIAEGTLLQFQQKDTTGNYFFRYVTGGSGQLALSKEQVEAFLVKPKLVKK